MRNMEKMAAEGRNLITGHNDLTYLELKQLTETAKEAGLFDALCNAFYSGFSAGHKARKAAANGKALNRRRTGRKTDKEQAMNRQ